ncbi:migration and invasion-inhibitory protein [Cuculus canorus]|uniref:migration and invasion-inhibitory protein n=1 Tax=Cuculus canorus TaxID=55661 RepID=UPI0023AB4663|nr:migration and invasion-inhibitory protein [Cuculus canorus]XP_053941808.1 migration and invasion-inhibitory protein [Cuculus canorus]XP_053941809.1 migration and invasion-inhibitory protein [Cuculus canorus]
MELEHLKKLREVNQDLLHRLRMMQEEMRKSLPSKTLFPASLHDRTATERSVPLPTGGKENQVKNGNSTADPAVLVSVEPGTHMARTALCSSLKHSSNNREVQEQQAKMQEAVGLDSTFPDKEKIFTSVSAIITCGRENSRVDRDGCAQGSPKKDSFLLEHGENRRQSTVLHDLHEKTQLKGHLDPSLSKIQSEKPSKQHVVNREPTIPESISLTSQSKKVKDAGHVTFQSDPEEYTVPVSSWSARPFLGYDWIAGLLETNSSIAEKSDQYFADLHEFRQANKEACIHEQPLEPEALDYVVPQQEPDLITNSHKCVYCYRLNQRLFTVPVDSESACPVCKIPRAHQPPEEPAHVRVSIPRSTLLPAYKYKAHRRKSFELADNLALPSHCLAGWKNIIPSSDPTLSSLDLRASLKEKPSHHARLVKELNVTAPACPS